MTAAVGSVFRWRYNALGIAVGAVGVCYARGRDRVGILFDNGVPTTLSDYDLNRYAEFLGRSLALSGYRFISLNQLLNDYGKGVFEGAFRGLKLERASAR